MRISSIQLLPQSSETQLPTHLKFSKALRLLKFFTQQTIEAINDFFIKQDICAFDPHIGETSCHIRAYQILLLTFPLKNVNKFEILNKLKYLEQLLSKINEDIIFYGEIDSKRRDRQEPVVTLLNFSRDKKYFFDLDETEFYLTQAKILTKYKIQNFMKNSEVDYERLSQDLEVSKNTARHLVHIYQVRLSEISCNFIFNLSKQIPQPPIVENRLRLLKKMDDDKRHVLPCYWVMKTIFAHMFLIKPTILLIIERILAKQPIDEICLSFTLSSNGEYFMCNEDPHYQLPEQAGYVIRGMVRYTNEFVEPKNDLIRRILNFGLEKIVLMNMAVHPQYSGKTLVSDNINSLKNIDFMKEKINNNYLEQEFFSMKMQAKLFGCSVDNPSLLYIEHIFCDQLKRQKYLQNKYSSDPLVISV